MAYTSVTYTFVNGTTSDATKVNTNFTDIVNGLSDSTKDLAVNNVAVAGTVTVTGAAKFDAAIRIKEGITAPDALAGYVQLYVDTTTSQLRCIDGSGVIYEVALSPVA